MTPIVARQPASENPPTGWRSQPPDPHAAMQFAQVLRARTASSAPMQDQEVPLAHGAPAPANVRQVTGGSTRPVPGPSMLPMFEDQAHAFTLEDFGFTRDGDADQLSAIGLGVIKLPAGATLTLAGVNVTPPAEIPLDQLRNLVLTPAAGTTSTKIVFNVRYTDGSGAEMPATLTIKSLQVFDRDALLKELGSVALDRVMSTYAPQEAFHEASSLVHFRRNLVDQAIRQSIEANANADDPEWVDY